MRFNHIVRIIVNSDHGGMRPYPTYHSGVGVDNVEDSDLKCLWKRLRVPFGVGEAVVEVGRAEDVVTAPREVPVSLALQSLTISNP